MIGLGIKIKHIIIKKHYIFLENFYENYLNFLNFKDTKTYISSKEGLKLDKILFDLYHEIFKEENNNLHNYKHLKEFSVKLLDKYKTKIKKNKKLYLITLEALNFLKQQNNKKRYKLLKKTFGRELNYIILQKLNEF